MYYGLRHVLRRVLRRGKLRDFRNCGTNVVLGGQSRRGARADCGVYDGAYGGDGS